MTSFTARIPMDVLGRLVTLVVVMAAYFVEVSADIAAGSFDGLARGMGKLRLASKALRSP